MMHRFLPEAETEFEDAETRYESEQPGLGERFVDAVEATVTDICRHPTIMGQIAPGIRFQKVRRFPYLVYYRVDDDCVVIVAVAHERRQFGYWKDRLPEG